jgi:hypothetical protein
MAYIGQSIKNGTFSVLDTSGNTYNGSNVTFSLGTQVGSAAQLLVSHDGVIQKPGTDYTLATGGTQITFTTAPASGASIFIVEISGAVGGPMNRDINGDELILDVDGDTSITADTDDQIDIKIAGADDFKFSANAMNVLSGSTLTIDSGATLTVSGSTNLSNGPAFHAYLGSNQTLSNNTFTSLNMNEQDFDTGSDYDTSNYRFTPGETGKYVLYGKVSASGGIDANDESLDVYIVKRDNSASSNVTLISQTTGDGAAGTNVGSVVMTVVDHTDVNDYYTLAAYSQGSASTAVAGLQNTYFGGYKLIL